jgi:predicted nucleic acid-binding protein
VNFADTNWLEAMFFNLTNTDKNSRPATVRRFLRQHGGQIVLSHLVYLEARNVFTRISGEAEPEEWTQLQQDLTGRFYLDPMNWDYLRRDTFELIARYGHKETLGTFDLALLASAKLSGATRLLSFDNLLKAVAVAEGLDVFPPLDFAGKQLLAKLKR